MTGRAPARVAVVDYDPAWPATFARLRERLVDALGPLALAVEHVGSTAVPGLAAKPIVDIDVVIAARSDLPEVARRLRTAGAYADLKRALAVRLGHDRVAYTEGKRAFIEQVLEAATPPRPPAARR